MGATRAVSSVRWVIGNLLLAATLVGGSIAITAGSASAAPMIVFDGSPGTAAPPGTLGSFTMTPFGPDGRTPLDVTTVPSPLGGDVTFDLPVNHRNVPETWTTWSHGYDSDVYWSNFDTTRTMTLPSDTGAFYFYAEPNASAEFTIVATAEDGTTSGPVTVDGFGGAKYYGFYGTEGEVLETITVIIDDGALGFAVGEFGIALAEAAPPSGRPGTCKDLEPFDTKQAGGAAPDTFTGTAGRDKLNGRSGDDTLYGSASSAPVSPGPDQGDCLLGQGGMDEINGHQGGDYISGGVDDDPHLDGDGGNDSVLGRAGSDTMFGGAGNDLVRGNGGDDVINGGAGEDELRGEGGNDSIHADDGKADLVRCGDGAADTANVDGLDTVIGCETVT